MIYDLYHFFYFFEGSQKQKNDDMITGKGYYTGMEEKKKHGSKTRGAFYMLHEPSMARPCMEGYLYVGKPASNEERRLVGDPAGCAGDVK